MRCGVLLDSLLNLFENAPENIILTGNFCWGSPDVEVSSDFDKHPYTGYFQQINITKDELLKIFVDLKNMTGRAIKNNGYLLHFGI